MGWFFRKKWENSHRIDDEGRMLSIETKKAGANLRAAELRIAQEKMELKWAVEKAEMEASLRDIQESLNDDNGGDANAMLMQLIAGNMGAGLSSSETATTPTTATAALLSLTDEQIMNVIDSFDKTHIRMAAKLPESVLLPQLKQRLPGYDEQTYSRAVALLKDRR